MNGCEAMEYVLLTYFHVFLGRGEQTRHCWLVVFT